MSEPNKDGTEMMMAMLMGLSGPRASRAWTEAQEIQAMSFLTLAEHWINETATEIVRVKEENARLKAEVERLTAELSNISGWGRGLESDLSHARVEISFLKAEVERLKEDNRQLTKVFEIAEGIIKRMGKAAEDAAKEGKPSV